MFVGGAVVQWLRDGLGIIRTSSEVEALANSVPDNGGVYFVPAFVGLGAPHWDSYARGAIFGLTRGSNAGHIARAALESIAYQVADLMDAVQTDTGTPLQELRVDGGASANDSSHAISGGHSRRARRAPCDDGDNRARRCISGWSGRRLLEGSAGNF